MEGFILPTQLALLVYGYLLEEGCSSAAESFMESSQYTKEARKYVKKGGIITKVHDLGLTDVIEILGEVVCYVKSFESSQPITLENVVRQLRCILRLNSDRENAQKPVYLRFTMQQSPTKKSPRKNRPSETNSPPKSCKSLPETTSSKGDGSVIIPSNVKVQQQIQVLLENKVLHEKLAENINQVVATKNESLDSILQKKIVETIYNKTEQDPFFQDMLEELIGPEEGSNVPEVSSHENDDIGNRDLSAPSDGVEEDSYRQMEWQEPSLLTNPVNKNSQLASSAGVQVPNTRNIADKALDKSAVSHALQPLPPACGPMGIQSPTPFVAKQPGLLPLNIQTALPSSTTFSPVTTQGAPAYVIASSPGTAVLNSLITPSVVIGTTFSGAAVKFTPSGPTTSWIRQVAPPQLETPPARVSRIKVLSNTPRVPSLKTVLPKQQLLPAGVMGQPIFQVPVTSQGNVQSGLSSLQSNVATVSVTAPATPIVPQSVPSKVKMGARTRGGKPKSYPGRKKIVQTIGPSTPISPENPESSKIVQSENKMDVVGDKKNLKVPEETIGSVSIDTLTTNDVGPRSSINDETAKPNSELCSEYVPDAKPEAEAADVGIPKSVAEVDHPDVGIRNSVAEVAKSDNKVTDPDAALVTISTHQSSSQEKGDVVLQSKANPVESSSSRSDVVPCQADATPQQGSEVRVNLRKRLSLSTPRRGSHVRTLEFETPPKNSKGSRKSLSSPKNKAPVIRRPELQQMLESVKKSELFKSPAKKEKKSWDADLRQYTTEEDIPTSVGLKRKSSAANKTGSASKNKGSKSTSKCVSVDPKSAEEPPTSVADAGESTAKSPEKVELIAAKTPDKKSETDEDLVSRIQRDVLDVIDEEDVADLSSTNCANLCPLIGDNSAGNIGVSPKSSSKLVASPMRSPGTSSVLEIGDIGLSASTIKKLYRRATSVDESSCTMDSPLSKAPRDNLQSSPRSPKQSRIEASKENLFASPIKSAIECAESSTPLQLQLQLSPSPRKPTLDYGSTPPPKGGIFSELLSSPGSGSLEATLIRECRRIENERMGIAPESRKGKTPDCSAPKVLCNSDAILSTSINDSDAEARAIAGKTANSAIPMNHLLPPIGITPLKTPGNTLLPVGITPLKTPGKSPLPVGITPLKTPGNPLQSAPVEMTPISKIINEETRLGKCTLLTPTIPPTPDYEVLKNQEQAAVDANISPPSTSRSPNVGQKTPQSKTPSPAVTNPSPPKKLPKTPKTPVVKLKKKPVEKPPRRTRQRKPTKKSILTEDVEVDTLYRMHVQQAEEAVYGAKNEIQNVINSGSDKKEELQKKKAPTQKRKVPQKSEAKLKKQSKTDEKQLSFVEILERFENNSISSPSSTECFTSSLPKQQCAPTNSPKTPKKNSKYAKKTPKKKAPKKKGARKKPNLKTKNKNTISKTPAVSSQVETEAPVESPKSLGTEDQQEREPSTVTCVSASSKECNQDLAQDLAISPDSGKLNQHTAEKSTLHQNDHTPELEIETNVTPTHIDLDNIAIEYLLVRDDIPVRPTLRAPAFVSLFEYPPPPSLSQNELVGPIKLLDDVCTVQKSEVEPGRLGKSSKEGTTSHEPLKLSNKFKNKEDGAKSKTRRPHSAKCSSSEEDKSPQEPLKLSNFIINKEKKKGKRKTSKKRQGKSSVRDSSDDEKSPKKTGRIVEGSNDELTEADKRTRRRSTSSSSSSSSEDSKSPKRPVKSSNDVKQKVEEIEETSKQPRTRRKSRISGSSDDEKLPRKSGRRAKRSKNELAEAGKRTRRRSKSSGSSSEDDESQRRPITSENEGTQKVEEIRETSKRRRRKFRISDSSDDEKSSKKPGRRVTESKDELAEAGKRTRRQSKSSGSSSEDDESQRGPVKSSKEGKQTDEEIEETSKRKRRNSSRSSSDEDRRKRRRTDGRRDHFRPKHERQTGGKFRAYRGGRRGGYNFSRSPHWKPLGRYSHRLSHRYTSSDDEKGRRKSRSKFSLYSGSRERDRSGSNSRDNEERKAKNSQDDSKKHQNYSKRQQDDSRKHHDTPNTHQEDSRKHQGVSKMDDSAKHQDDCARDIPMKDKDSKKADRRETALHPKSNDESIEKQAGNNAEAPPKPIRGPFYELEDGEISEESRNTIFQFSKNSSHPGGSTDRLSSPVASESRQKLLKNVNVDKFLSLVHGDAKSPLTKEESINQQKSQKLI